MLIKFLAALIAAFVSWNLIVSFCLWQQPQYKFMPKGIVALPGSISVRSQEGYSRRQHVNEFGTFHEIRTDLPLIVFQGDSYTYAEQVEVEENYSSLVRKKLYNKFEILNAGNFGMDVGHYIYNKKYFEPYSPVFHIIQVKHDDFFDSFDVSSPLHIKLVDGHISFEQYRTGFMEWVEKNPKVYNFLNSVSLFSYVRDKYLQDINSWIKKFGKKKNTKMEQSQISQPPVLAQISRKEKIILQIKMLKETYGDQFALLYLPRNPVMAEGVLHVEDEEEKRFDNEILEICYEYKVRCISMWNPFLDFYKKTHQLTSGFENTIPGTGHINKNGHAVIAEQLVNFINEEIHQ